MVIKMFRELNRKVNKVEVLYLTSYQDYLSQTPSESIEPFIAFCLDKAKDISDVKSTHDLIDAINLFYLKQGENPARVNNIKKSINWYKQQEVLVNKQLESPFTKSRQEALITKKQDLNQAIHALEEVLIEMNTTHGKM